MQMLEEYDWKGNVRELENVIERAVVLSTDSVLSDRYLPAELKRENLEKNELPFNLPAKLDGSGLGLQAIVENVEKELVMKAYREAGGVKAKAAKLLGIKRGLFRYKFDKYCE